jgi:Chaperone of endosialidase
MTERTRSNLQQEFQDGERPSGADFADVFDSFLNKQDDGLSVDLADHSLVLNRGLRLGDSIDNQPGTLRFNAGNLQIHNGAAFVTVGAGGAGAFTTTPGGNAAYSGAGRVGIGAIFAGSEPAFKLDVPLANNSGPAEQVRLGRAVVCNGVGVQAGAAHFSHETRASATDFALRQTPSGEVSVNAPLNVPIFLLQGGSSATPRLAVSGDGRVLVATAAPISPAPNSVLQVNGNAVKNQGGNLWDVASDLRVKEDVATYSVGLDAIRAVRPVCFRYNGKAGTVKGSPGIGIIGQEMEKVMPETVSVVASTEAGIEDLRIYNGSALIFALVNAVRELSDRVEALEATLATRTPTVN